MNRVSNKNLEHDLLPLFLDSGYIKDWIKNWRDRYFLLLNSYNINSVSGLFEIIISQDFNTDNFYFTFVYNTDEGKIFRIVYTINESLAERDEGDLSLYIDDNNYIDINIIRFISTIKEKYKNRLLQYVSIFYKKNEDYFKKTKNIVFGDKIITKVIRMTADKFNQKEETVLNKSALVSCELEDLLK